MIRKLIPLCMAGLVSFFLGVAIGRLVPSSSNTYTFEKTQSQGEAPQLPGGLVRIDTRNGVKSSSEATALPASNRGTLLGMPSRLQVFVAHISSEALRSAMWKQFLQDPDAKVKLLELLLNSDDQQLLMDGRVYLAGTEDPAILAKLTEAYLSEPLHSRKTTWAYLIGSCAKHPQLHPYVRDIIAGEDTALKTALLEKLSVLALQRDAQFQQRIALELRKLATQGNAEDIRAAAVKSLKGDYSLEGVQFLIDRITGDASLVVRSNAIQSLPITYFSPSPMLDTQVLVLMQTAGNEGLELSLRRLAARQIIDRAPQAVSEAERTYLRALLSR